MNLSLLISRVTKVGLWTYKSYTALWSCTSPMYACCLLCEWVGPEPYVKTKCFVSYFFLFYQQCSRIKRGASVDTEFCTPHKSGPRSQWCWNSKAQGWFRARLDWNWLKESVFEKYNSFMNQISYCFGKEKSWKPKGMRMHTHVCTHTLKLCVRMLHACAC